jgi:hypothetical protein
MKIKNYESTFFFLYFSVYFKKLQDPFGEDPFAALHAPLRPESPSPALPPKKSKQPPPRPAPPRPIQGPQTLLRRSPPITSLINSNDPFNNINSINNTTNNAFDFADFAKFNQKVSIIIIYYKIL